MFGELCEKLHDCTFTEDCERISSPKIPAKVNRSSDAKVRELLSKVYQELHQVSLEQSSHMPYAKTIASDGFFEAAHAAIDGIHHDFALDSAHNSEDMELQTPRSCTGAAASRLKGFAIDNGVMMTGILAFSQTFRRLIVNMDAESWTLMNRMIKVNAVSLEVFAKTRGIDWKTPLTQLAERLPLSARLAVLPISEGVNIDVSLPISYIIPDQRFHPQAPPYRNSNQINIGYNIYDKANFENSSRPPFWPKNVPYPSDPTLRRPDSPPCIACHNIGRNEVFCACDPKSSSRVTRPLVELKDYGIKGNGIRTLQCIKKGDILGEYVGVLMPWNDTSDQIYGMEYSSANAPNSKDIALAQINSNRYGNWTRFLNHSCQASTAFRIKTFGRFERVLVVAVRDAEPFEELTVDYGREYWRTRECFCGEVGCYNDYESDRRINPQDYDTDESGSEGSGCENDDVEVVLGNGEGF